MIENYLELRNLGFIEGEDIISDELLNSKENKVLDLISDTLKEFGSNYMVDRDYTQLIKESFKMVQKRNWSNCEIFKELKEVKNAVKRVNEVDDKISQMTYSKHKFAAATKLDKLFDFENFECYEYKVEIRVVNDVVKIIIFKAGEPYTGNFGFVIGDDTREERIEYNIENGYVELEMVKEEEMIKDDSIKTYFILP